VPTASIRSSWVTIADALEGEMLDSVGAAEVTVSVTDSDVPPPGGPRRGCQKVVGGQRDDQVSIVHERGGTSFAVPARLRSLDEPETADGNRHWRADRHGGRFDRLDDGDGIVQGLDLRRLATGQRQDRQESLDAHGTTVTCSV
jgi:hypothetical protein